MRLAEGNIGKEGRGLFLHPAIRLVRHHLCGPAFGFSDRFSVAVQAVGVALNQIIVAGEPIIEALVTGPWMRLAFKIAQMPLAEHTGGEAFGLQDLGNGGFGIRQVHRCVFVPIAVHAHPKREATGQQSGARGRAVRRRCVVFRKTHPVFCQLVDMRCIDLPTETAKILPTGIVEIYDHHIGRRSAHLDAKPCQNHSCKHAYSS